MGIYDCSKYEIELDDFLDTPVVCTLAKNGEGDLYINDMDEIIKDCYTIPEEFQSVYHLSDEEMKYNHYMEYIRCIPSEYCADWSRNTVLQREWNKDDAEFCYLFVANALLDWQIHDMGPIQETSADINEFRLSEKICGVETRKHFVEKGCKYELENQTADLFYVASKEELEELKKGIEKGIACCEFKRWCFEQLQAYHTYLIKINNSDYRFIMNNPPTWEMIVFYDNIPFTNKDMCGNGIDIDGELDGSFDEAIKEILQQYIPLETVEKANELLEKLNKLNLKDVDRLYSSKLINKLTVIE